MKKIIVFLSLIFCLGASNKTLAYYFSSTHNGTTIYYNITLALQEVEVTYATTNYNTYTGAVVIPATVTGNDGYTYSVTGIGEHAFRNSVSLTSVTIPNSVKTIGNYAFYNCSGLTSVTIPDSVTTIGSYAFYRCLVLTGTLTIPNSVTTIGYSAFAYCSGLTSVTIPDSVTTIENATFYYCSGLTSITIPNSVTTIGHYAFCECSGLTSITIGNSVTTIGNYAFYNCLGSGHLTIPNSVTSIGTYAFTSCKFTSVTIPNSVTSIGNYAFSACKFTSVTIPNSITTIGDYVFYGCVFTSITIPNSVTTIGNYAFTYCQDLTSVTIPNSVKTIGSYAFGYCIGLTSVTIGNSVTTIGDNAFYLCTGLRSVTIGNSVTNIGSFAFGYCSGLTAIYVRALTPPLGGAGPFLSVSTTIPVHVICGRAATYQSNTSWKSFTNIIGDLPFGVTLQSNDTVRGTTNIVQANTCTNNTTIIGATPKPGYHFVKWNDNDTANPRTLTLTKDTAFTAIFELTQYAVIVGSNNSNMGYAMVGNSFVIGIYAKDSAATINAIPYSGHRFIKWNDNITINPRTITVTKDTVFTAVFDTTLKYSVAITANNTNMGTVSGSGIYEEDSTATFSATPLPGYRFIQWNDSITTNPRTITVTKDTSFTAEFKLMQYDFTAVNSGQTIYYIITSVVPPQTVEVTYASTNYNTYSGAVVIPASVTNNSITYSVTGIGDYAFYNSSGLTSVSIPTSVSIIRNNAFGGCSSLPSISLPTTVTIVGDYAFEGCSGLTTISLPASVQTIGKGAFAGCSGITSVNIPTSVTAIADSAFSYCSGLTSVSIPSSVTAIGNNAFDYCDGLTTVSIPNSVITIGNAAFEYCTGLTSVNIGSSVKTIGNNAFGSCYVLTTVNIPNSVTAIGDNAFIGDTGITSIDIPNSVMTIGNGAFASCNGLSSIVIGDAVTTIGYSAFSYCLGLKSLTIGKSVTNIEFYGFGGCSGLTVINVKSATPPVLDGTSFEEVGDTIPIHVPCGTATAYQSASQWSRFDYFTEDIRLYDLILQSNDEIMGTTNMIQVNTCSNDTAVIMAMVNTGYRFIQWHDGITDPLRTVVVTQDSVFRAEFMPYMPLITLSVNDVDMGSVTGSGYYAENSAVTIRATPALGYRFVRWNDSITTNPRTLTLGQDTSFTAVFEALIHLTVTANDPLMGSVSGEGSYVKNATAIIEAVPNTNCLFVCWNDSITSNPRTITLTQDTSFTAVFEGLIHLTTAVNDAVMGSVSGEGYYEKNTTVIIAAIPNTNYHFVQWNDGDTNNPRTITVTQNTTFTATFVPDFQELLAQNFEGGSGTSLSGWTFVNGSQTNKWYVGTATAKGGSKSAYISDNSSSNAYSTSSASVVHLYTNVTLPTAGYLGYMLSFDWKSAGEVYYDYFEVFLEDATVTPTAGSGLSNPVYRNVGSGTATWKEAVIFIPLSATASKRLIFCWRNDASVGDQPPVAIDNVVIKTIMSVYATVNLTTAGSLKSQTDIKKVTHLTLTGKIDARDIQFMRDSMPLLMDLNLAGVSIVAYTGTAGTDYGTSTSYYANTMPVYSFYNGSTSREKTILASIKLPAGLISIESYAFGYCTGLKTIYVKALTPPTIANNTTFINVSTSIPVHVPCGRASNYQNANRWSAFTNIIADIPLYDISVKSNDAAKGKAAITQANTCSSNTVTISATANAGCRFVQWNDGDTTNPRTLTLTKDTSLTAEFSVINYSVTISVNNSTMGSVSGGGNYAVNTSVILSATANTNYRFVRWNDGNTTNPRTITLTKDTSFTAEFGSANYSVTVSANNPSMGSVSGNGSYVPNTSLTLNATANTNYRFMQWNDGVTTNPRTIIVTRDTSFTAIFDTIRYNVTVSSNNSSMGSVSGGGTYVKDSIATIRATATATNRFVKWNDGVTTNPRTITVTRDTSFTATFEVIPPYDFAANNANGITLYYKITSSTAPRTAKVTYSTSNARNSYTTTSPIVIPSTASNGTYTYTVTALGDSAFYYCANITAVTLPNTVKTIGQRTFSNCSGLTSINLGDSLTTISHYAFYGSAFTTLTLPRTLTSIGNYAFYDCSKITSIYVKAVNPPAIGNNADPNTFGGGVSATIPVHVPCGADAAYKDTTVAATKYWGKKFTNILGDITDFKITVQSNNTSMGTATVSQANSCSNDTAIITAVPVAQHRFVRWNDNLTVNPRTVTLTKDTVFTAVFEFIPPYDFAANNANGITIYYKITSNTAPRTAKVTYSTANTRNSYTTTSTIVIPSTASNGSYTYTVTALGDSAFYYCANITAVTLPNTVKSIGVRTFSNCSGLKTVNLGDSLTTISPYAFYSCALTTLTLPKTLTSIGNYAFYYCSKITDMYVKAINPPAIADNTFGGDVSKTMPVHVPCGTVSAYQSTAATNYWDDFTNIIGDIPFGLTVQSNDTRKGTASITQTNSCSNDTVIIKATPNTDYRFMQWNDGNTNNPRTVTVTKDTLFTAIFDSIRYNVTITANNAVMGTVSGGGTYVKNGTATITAVPNTGYRFIQWNDGNTSRSRTIIVTKDITFTAAFGTSSQGFFHVSAFANNTMMGTVTGDADYAKDSSSTLTAVANVGYHFVQWHDGDTNNPRTITVTRDTTFTAVFISDNPEVFFEDFEGGTGTNLSGWTFVNGGLTNKWYVGTATANGGTKAAYISNNSGTSNAYTITSTSWVYLYTDVSLPTVGVSGYLLSFDWKSAGESNYDYFEVYWEDATVTPTAGSLLNSRRVYYTITSSSWREAVIFLPPSATATKRLIFFWRNDNSVGTQPPVAIDNVVIKTFTPVYATVNLTTAGSLKSQSNIKEVTHLTLTGNIDARDVQFMRDSIPLLVDLNLTGANILAYSGTEGTNYGTSSSYPANTMPTNSFYKSNTGGKAILTSIKLPAGLISIGTYAFSYCTGLRSLTIPNSVTTIGNNAFGYSNLTSVTIGNSVTTIGNSAFLRCGSLRSVTIPNSVTTIGTDAFYYCSGLTSLTIGNSVATIGGNAFYNCTGLTEIYVKALTPPALISTSFNSVTKTIPVHVPCGKLSDYQNASIWSVFTNIIADVPLYELSVASNDTVMGKAAMQSHSCSSNTAIIGAAPNTNYRFMQWNDGNTNNPRTITLSQDTAFTAIFDTIRYAVTLTANNAVMGTVSGGGTYVINGSVAITAVPNTGYRFIRWNDGNTSNPRTITVTQDTTFTATLGTSSQGFFHVSAFSDNTMMGTVTGDADYAKDSSSTLTAIASADYHFVQWNDGDTNNPRTITVTQDTTFTAFFISDNPELFFEDFEGGSGTNLSGWTFVNGSQTNKWYIGTATANGGTKAAYISNDNGTSNVYTITATSRVYLYTDVSLPTIGVAGYALSFDWKSMGENNFDYFEVYWEDDTVMPTAGSLLNSRRVYYTIMSSSWGEAIIFLPLSATSTKRLIFFWRNDQVTGTQPPVAIDNVVIKAIMPVYATVNLTTAGSLKSQSNIKEVTHLTLTGNIDARDVQFMRDSIPLLVDLNLTGANILAYSGTEGTNYGTSSSYPANTMPTNSFYKSNTGGKAILTSIKLPAGLISIGTYAFSYCSGLRSVTIGNSVTTIGNNAFRYCSSLTSVTIPNSVTTIGDYAFNYCSSLTSVTIPNSVTTIGDYAFNYCSSLRSVTIGNSVTTIEANAFSYCDSLRSLTIGNSVTTIGDYAFYHCDSLRSLTIPNSVTTIGGRAFSYCSGLTSITIPNTVKTIGDYAFYYCRGLTSVTIPNSVTTIGTSAFSYCSGLTSITIPNSVKTIGTYAFSYCSGLRSVTIGTSVTTIGDYVFYYCNSLRSVTIPNSVTTIGGRAFSYCNSLRSVTIPNSVKTIGDYAFFRCDSLRSATIGNSVTTIGNYTFYYCSGLTEIYVKALTPPALTDANVFTNVTKTIPVHVPCGKQSNYQNATIWGTFTNIIADVPLYDLSVGSNDTVMGKAAITQSHSCSSNTAIIGAVANTDCRFMQWNDGDTANPRTITLSQDSAFTAIFDTIRYAVTVTSNEAIMGTVTGTGTYVINSSVAITAVPSANLYRFVQWNDGDTANPRTITVTQDTTFTATFDTIRYNVSVMSNDSSMGTVTGRGMYTKDATVVIEAVPHTTYRFVQWNDGNTQNPRTIILTKDTVFTAIFSTDVQGVFSVYVTVNNTVMGRVIGEGAYSKDSTAVIEAIANTGYHFVKWQEDGNTDNPRTITVIQDTSFTAIFDTIRYNVSVMSNDSSMGTVTGTGVYFKDATVVIEAVPHTTYRFVQWNDGNMQNPRTITVTQDTTFTAIFSTDVQGVFSVYVTVNNTNMGRVTGSGNYAKDSNIVIEAIANVGYRFVQWKDGITTNPRTITVTQDTTFTAEFSALQYYRITVTVNNQSMGRVTGSGNFAKDSTTIIEAIANAGYRFVQWRDGNTDNPRTITVTQDATYTAEFATIAAKTYHVTVSANAPIMGTVTGEGDYEENTTATIEAIANAGYRFVQWNDANTNSLRTITVTQDTNFVATFAEEVGITTITTSTINVYPNPANDKIHIVLPENVFQAVFTLYDMQGKILMRKVISNQEVVSVNDLSAGIYVYEIQNCFGKLRIER